MHHYPMEECVSSKKRNETSTPYREGPGDHISTKTPPSLPHQHPSVQFVSAAKRIPHVGTTIVHPFLKGAKGGPFYHLLLRHPCILGIPKQRGTKSELAASPLPSRGPKRGRKCYVTPAFSGIPKQRGTKSELAASPLPFRGPKRGQKCCVTPAFSGVPYKGGQNQNWLPHP